MALWINSILSVLILLASHPLHMSFTNFEYNEEGRKWELTFKLFKDDFSDEVKRLYGLDLSLESEQELEGQDVYFRRFIDDQFSVAINGENIETKDWEYQGSKLNFEAIWLEFSFNYTGKPKKVQIENRLMFGLFEDQKNLLIFTYKGQQKAYQFRHNKPEAIIEIE